MNVVVKKSIEKVKRTRKQKLVMGFMAGAMIALAYIPMIKFIDMFGSHVGTLMGALFFPIGLILVLYMGGELVSGNMTVVGIGFLKKEVTFLEMIKNWIDIFIGNTLGVIFAVVVLGYGSGILTSLIPTLETMAQGKLSTTPLQALLSGIGCNWFVGLGVMFFYKYKEGVVQFLGIYLSVAIFVVIGFQHCVANLAIFVLPLLLKTVLLKSVLLNVGMVTLGNIFGGVIFVGLFNTTTSQV